MNGRHWHAFYRHALPLAAGALGIAIGLAGAVIALLVAVLW